MTDMTADLNGREYAKASQLKAGDEVQIDDGFTCLRANSTHIVFSGNDPDALYIRCDEGIHWLGGQLAADGETLIGVYRIGSDL